MAKKTGLVTAASAVVVRGFQYGCEGRKPPQKFADVLKDRVPDDDSDGDEDVKKTPPAVASVVQTPGKKVLVQPLVSKPIALGLETIKWAATNSEPQKWLDGVSALKLITEQKLTKETSTYHQLYLKLYRTLGYCAYNGRSPQRYARFRLLATGASVRNGFKGCFVKIEVYGEIFTLPHSFLTECKAAILSALPVG